MQNDFDQANVKLHLIFPKSSEDRKLQLVKINNSIFAIIHEPLESDGPIQLLCQDWSLILLSPIKSKSNIVISAKNIICLNKMESEEGIINIHAIQRLVKFAPMLQPIKNLDEIAEGNEHSIEDLGALMYYYRVFQSVVNDAHTNLFSEAQHKFMVGLCALAQKIESTETQLTLPKVLDVWGIL